MSLSQLRRYMALCVCTCLFQSTSPLVFYLHDAMYLYTRALNKTIAEGGDYRNGTLLVNNSIGQHFTGIALNLRNDMTLCD